MQATKNANAKETQRLDVTAFCGPFVWRQQGYRTAGAWIVESAGELLQAMD